MASRETRLMITAILAVGAREGQASLSPAVWEWWLVFGGPVLFFALEIWVFERVLGAMSRRRATIQWLLSVILAVAFGAFVYVRHGLGSAQDYFTGYLLEYSLSIDNVAVWLQVLFAFRVRQQYVRKLLLIGVAIAIVLRVVFIVLGATVLERIAAVAIVMGAFLIFTGFKLAKQAKQKHGDSLEDNAAYRLITKWLPYTHGSHAGALITRQAGGRLGFKFTRLGIAAIVFAAVDVMFAVDSVPTILSITTDPYIVISSNMMALLGLLSVYFLFDSIKHHITRLNEGLAFILTLVGIKLIIGSQLFWDIVWNGYNISWWWVIGTGALLYGFWIWQKLRGTETVLFEKATYITSGLLLIKLYAGASALSELKRSIWQAHEVHVHSAISFGIIVLTLFAVWWWGKVSPGRSQHTAADDELAETNR